MEKQLLLQKRFGLPNMAKGLKCARCGYWMYAQEEISEGGRNRVYYVCRSCSYATTVWE
jgi:hypothetical protein